MATQNSNNNDVNVTSLFPINITTVDDISLASSNQITIAGTNGTEVQDDTLVSLDSSGQIHLTSAGTTNIVSNYNGVAAIGIGANGSDPSTTLQIGCASGTGDEAVLVYAEGGGITHQAASNINLTSGNNTIITATGNFDATSSGTATIISNDSVVAAVAIAANGSGAGTTMQIGCALGTGDEAVLVYAEGGGITLEAASGVHLNYGTDSVQIGNGAQTFEVLAGDVNPDGAVSALQGSLFVDVTGTGNDTLYVNTNGSTAWTALGSGGGGGGFTWNLVTTAGPITLAPNNGYFCAFAGLITFVLPTTCSFGDRFAIYNIQASSNWTLTQNALQYIRFVGTATTVGTGGSITGNTTGDGIDFTCMASNFFFIVTSAAGNPTIV
jgi:hypothetical protein